MPQPPMIRALACAAAVAACLVPAGSAQANSSQESIFQDDLLLVGSGSSVRASALDELQSLGVDTIRVFVPWSQLAPDATSTVRPAGPLGHTAGPLARRPVATAEFWRDLLCIDRTGRRLAGRAAAEQGCRGATRLEATAIAHHPYIRGGSRSPLTPARRDEITISS